MQYFASRGYRLLCTLTAIAKSTGHVKFVNFIHSELSISVRVEFAEEHAANHISSTQPVVLGAPPRRTVNTLVSEIVTIRYVENIEVWLSIY